MKPLNKEVDFTFYPTKDFKECPVCGICSFPHIHRKGTFPKDFERIEPENKSTNEEWEKRFIREFVNDHNQTWRPLRGLWVEDVLEFITKEKQISEEKGYQRGYKEGVDDTLDEYGDGPSS